MKQRNACESSNSYAVLREKIRRGPVHVRTESRQSRSLPISWRELLLDALALLALFSVGIVWPDAPPAADPYLFDVIAPGGPLRFDVTVDWNAGAGSAPPLHAAQAAAHLAGSQVWSPSMPGHWPARHGGSSERPLTDPETR